MCHVQDFPTLVVVVLANVDWEYARPTLLNQHFETTCTNDGGNVKRNDVIVEVNMILIISLWSHWYVQSNLLEISVLRTLSDQPVNVCMCVCGNLWKRMCVHVFSQTPMIKWIMKSVHVIETIEIFLLG